MLADHFGLKQDGPSIGDNVGNAIYARSGNGIVYDGAVRDINGLKSCRTSHHLFATTILPIISEVSPAEDCSTQPW